MSRDFIILTDSASDLDANYLKRNDIELIKLGYNINNEDYAGEEEKELDVQEFYRILKEGTLEDFLDAIFIDSEKTSVYASLEEKEKFAAFIARYKQGLLVEKSAEKHFQV